MEMQGDQNFGDGFTVNLAAHREADETIPSPELIASVPDDRDELITIYTPGMGGMDWFSRRFVAALREAELDVEAHDWTEYRNQLRNLRDRELHQKAAAALVAKIATVEEDRRGRGIVLLGHSTGCDVILQALAQLEGRVDQVILMAPAVAPTHDVRPALAHVERMLVLSSALDPAVSLGTTLVGTSDGVHRPAAGWLGFCTVPQDPRLQQRCYRPRWALSGHLGGHLGYLCPQFARSVVVPLIRE